MTSFAVPLCYSCAHLVTPDDLPMRCAAYPDGIPEPILNSEVDHRAPYDGDQGIQFAQDPNMPVPDLTVFEGPP